MPRKPRIMSSTGIYHIILRSVNQHIIFEEDSDYRQFIYFMSVCKQKYEAAIYAYCLMDNHIHILLKIHPDKLSTFFQSLETRFVRWYNNKYLRSGHLFQDRFHSTPIECNEAFLSALVYIHNNPVKANVCRYSSEYRWSSHGAYYGNNDFLVEPSLAYSIAGTRYALLQYFAKKTNRFDHDTFTNDHMHSKYFLTDEKALEVFKSVTKMSSTSEAACIPKTKRNEFIRTLKNSGLTTKQVARLIDVSESTVKRLCKMTH